MHRSLAEHGGFATHACAQQRTDRGLLQALVFPADGVERERKAGSSRALRRGLVECADVGIVGCMNIEVAGSCKTPARDDGRHRAVHHIGGHQRIEREAAQTQAARPCAAKPHLASERGGDRGLGVGPHIDVAAGGELRPGHPGVDHMVGLVSCGRKAGRGEQARGAHRCSGNQLGGIAGGHARAAAHIVFGARSGQKPDVGAGLAQVLHHGGARRPQDAVGGLLERGSGFEREIAIERKVTPHVDEALVKACAHFKGGDLTGRAIEKR